MDERIVHLTDGTKLEVKVNFATLYYMQKCGLNKMLERVKHSRLIAEAEGREYKLTDDQGFDITAKMIYVIIRSNGKAVTVDEAMMLIPPDADEISAVFEEFMQRLDEYGKKQEAQRQMKNIPASR